ncbi:hypothetical protein L2750_10060 [Shewanella submarina]|uniref:Aminoglycoside phosphotransferase domain-containing protein n=1 Tax=Shewanella submarina TaxID=2016376 RepID=A0ABV7GED1_9GAMM|nr:hypothetical protein [Shewanella submarina]MCL1037491.1 hypothetical protein [Shewanella submarina]
MTHYSICSLFSSDQDSEEIAKYFFIVKKNGRDFWLIEDKFNSAVFLKSYPQITLKAKLYSILLKTIWYFRLQSIFFEKRAYMVSGDSDYEKICRRYTKVGVFFGTPGVNRKFVVVAQKKDGRTVYFKIPTSDESRDLVKNEVVSLQSIDPADLAPHLTPQVLNIEGANGFTEVSARTARISKKKKFSLLWDFYQKLSSKTIRRRDLNEVINELYDYLGDLKSEFPNNNYKFSDLTTKCKQQIEHLSTMSNYDIEMYKAHGDFTYWNMFIGRNEISVLDWELSSFKPKYFDLIHLIVSNSILVERKEKKAVYRELSSIFNEYFLVNNKEFQKYFRLYLLYQSTYYLNKYRSQLEPLHVQIFWQIETWAALLDSIGLDDD